MSAFIFKGKNKITIHSYSHRFLMRLNLIYPIILAIYLKPGASGTSRSWSRSSAAGRPRVTPPPSVRMASTTRCPGATPRSRCLSASPSTWRNSRPWRWRARAFRIWRWLEPPPRHVYHTLHPVRKLLQEIVGYGSKLGQTDQFKMT